MQAERVADNHYRAELHNAGSLVMSAEFVAAPLTGAPLAELQGGVAYRWPDDDAA